MILLAKSVSTLGQGKRRFLSGERAAPLYPTDAIKSGPYTRAINCHRYLINQVCTFEQYIAFLEEKPCLQATCDDRDEIHEKETYIA